MEEKKEEKVRESIKLFGNEYEIEVLDAYEGLALWHEYMILFGENAEKIMSYISDHIKTEEDIEKLSNLTNEQALLMFIDGDTHDILKLICKILTVERLFQLCFFLLRNAKLNDEVCDEKGMCKTFGRRPMEAYKTIVAAIMVNYGDYFPFHEGEEGTEENPSQK